MVMMMTMTIMRMMMMWWDLLSSNLCLDSSFILKNCGWMKCDCGNQLPAGGFRFQLIVHIYIYTYDYFRMLHMFIVNQHQNNSRDGNRTLQSPIPVFVGVFTVLTIQHHRKKGIEFRTDALSSEVPTPNSNEDPIYRSRKLHGCGDWDAHRSAEDLRIQGTQPRPQRRRVQL